MWQSDSVEWLAAIEREIIQDGLEPLFVIVYAAIIYGLTMLAIWMGGYEGDGTLNLILDGIFKRRK